MNDNSSLQPTPSSQQQQKPLSPLLISIIVISIVAGIGLLGLLLLYFRKRNSNNNKHDIESNNNNNNKKKRVFSFSSSSNTGEKPKDVPVTSSLDNQDVFFTLLEYPPTQPPISLQNNRLLDIPTTTANTTCSSYSVYEDRRKLLNMSDPISASLARQSIEERSGYYKSPTRTPVPYYQHKQSQKESSSIITSSSNSHHLTINNDEDKEVMQRWSTTSYHVW